MKKSEPAAIKTDGSVKEAPVVLLRTVLEPEKKPALKTEAKAGALSLIHISEPTRRP